MNGILHKNRATEKRIQIIIDKARPGVFHVFFRFKSVRNANRVNSRGLSRLNIDRAIPNQRGFFWLNTRQTHEFKNGIR